MTPSAASDLGRRFLRGSFYLGTANVLTYAINFGLALLLARLLGPEIFGFYAFVLAANELLNLFTAFSIALALLQCRDESDELYDSAYALSIGFGGLALLASLAIAPFLASLRTPEAGWFILILAGCRIALLMSQIHLVRLERRLRFGAVAAIGIMAGIAPNLAALALAHSGAGAWSLVSRDAIASLLNLVVAAWLSGYRFRRRVTRPAISQLMRFARPMFFARSLEIVTQRIDQLLVGGFMGDRTLGLYYQGRYLAEAGMLAARPLTRLTFNLYARLQDEPDRLQRSYEIVNYFLVRLMLAGSAVLLIFPEQTVLLLLGKEWTAAAPILRTLALYAGLLPVFENLKTLLLGRGSVRSNVILRLVQLAVMVPGILISVAIGQIAGVALSLVAMVVVGLLLARYYNREVLDGSLASQFLKPLLALACVCLVFWLPWEQAMTLPTRLLPFLPAPVYLLMTFALEPRRFARQCRYLWIQMKDAPPVPPGVENGGAGL